MKVKIVSDGTARGTEVVNAETGESINHVTRIVWEVSVDTGLAAAVITLGRVPVEVVADAKVEKIAAELA